MAVQKFKFVWKIEDFSLWSGGKNSGVEWPSTSMTIEALGNTQWQIDVCPRNLENKVACFFQRTSFPTEEQEHVSFHYKFYLQGKDNSLYGMTLGVVSDLELTDVKSVSMIRRGDLRLVHLPDDRLTIAGELWQKEPSEPLDFSANGKWEDELEKLSDDMRKLFETRYLSDVKLVSDDGRQIAVHTFVLYARWRKLLKSLRGRRETNRIAVHGVSGSALSVFASYLYTGKISESDVTRELFDFAAENAAKIREHFHTRTSKMCFRTRQKKEHLTFTWHADDLRVDSMPFFRVLRLKEVTGYEVLVDFRAEEDGTGGERYFSVTFSLSEVPKESWISLQCTATLFIDDVPVNSLTMEHHFESYGYWHLPNFIPMRLLTSDDGERPTRRRVQFEMVVSDEPLQTVVQTTETEFRTGSAGISHAELVAYDFGEFFRHQQRGLSDVTLRTIGGCFLSCRALLSARSETFRRFFRKHRNKNMVVGVSENDSVLLANALQYIYTGWTNLPKYKQNLNMYDLAKRLSLFGLVKKCQQFICVSAVRSIL